MIDMMFVRIVGGSIRTNDGDDDESLETCF
jgi:hypothetical protein